MKKFMVVFVALCVSIPVIQAAGDYTDYSGYVSFDALDSLQKGNTSVDVYLNESILSILSGLKINNDPHLSELLSGLKMIRVEQFDLTDNSTSKAETAIASIDKQLMQDDWARMVRVREMDESVDVYFKGNKDRIEGLLIMVLESGSECVFVNVVGEIDPSLLAHLAGEFGVPDLKIHWNEIADEN